MDWDLEYTLWNYPQVNTTEYVKIGSGNDLVSSGHRPLPEPKLTQIYVPIWNHQAKIC